MDKTVAGCFIFESSDGGAREGPVASVRGMNARGRKSCYIPKKMFAFCAQSVFIIYDNVNLKFRNKNSAN